MENQEQVENFVEYQKQFKRFFQHRKKIRALENFSATLPVKFQHKKMLAFAKEALNEGFLCESGHMFLEDVLKEFQLHYLTWARRTKWVKDKMGIKTSRRAKPQPRPVIEQMLIDFEKKYTPVEYPRDLIAMQQHQSALRI